MQSSVNQPGAKGAVLQANLSFNVFGVGTIGFENTTGGKINVASFDLHQEYITCLVDHHDVNFAVLLVRAIDARPSDAVKQRVGVRQAAF